MSPRLVTRALQAALKLWLRSQTDALDELHIQIQSSDRQLLGGTIPEIAIAANRVIYNGLHLSQISLQGQNIRTNLPQILKGQTFRLLDPIHVETQLQLHQTDLNASLQSPLLAPLLQQWVQALLDLLNLNTIPTHPPTIDLSPPPITLQISDPHLQLWVQTPIPLGLQAHITPHAGRYLHLQQVEWLQPPALTPPALTPPALTPLEGLQVDLGSDVQLLALKLQDQTLHCTGQLLIRP